MFFASNVIDILYSPAKYKVSSPRVWVRVRVRIRVGVMVRITRD
jgi:hypothetical protein